MPSARVLRGVVGNTLSSYVSRYSHYDGYWLFGFLVPGLQELEVDLLGASSTGSAPIDHASRRAQAVFREQLAKAGYPHAHIARASLVLSQGEPMYVAHEFRRGDGWRVIARVSVTTLTGRTFGAERSVGVCSHDPQRESQSAGAA
jgi:hypothetical protein